MSRENLYYLNIYCNRFLGDMVPVMPILGLLLLERGFTLSTISLFFLCVAITIIVVEIPAGFIADIKNPRLVVIISRLFKLLAFATLFIAFDIYTLCLAAVLWGLSSAFDSGAMQSYLFQLTRQRGDQEKFESVYGNTFTASLLGLLVAGLLAAQITVLGFTILQYIGIGALVLCVLSVLFFPRVAEFVPIKEASEGRFAYGTSFRSLLSLKPILFILLGIGIFAGGIKGSLDEYVTLLLADKGLAFGVIGYVVFCLEVLKTGGAAIASRFKLSIRIQLLVLGILGCAFLAAALGNFVVAIIALVTVIFIDAILWVHNDTAIQRQASDENRATVASVKNFGTEVLAAGVFFMTWLFGESIDQFSLYDRRGLVGDDVDFIVFEI